MTPPGCAPEGSAQEARGPSTPILFILEFGEALHRVGTPAHRLETALERVSELFGLEGQFFTTPTSIIASFGPVGAQQTSLIRLQPGTVDLGRLARVDEIVNGVIARTLSLEVGIAAIRGVMAAPRTASPLVLLLASTVAAATGARFFGGGYREMAVGSAVGALVALLERLMSRVGEAGSGVYVSMASALVAFSAALAAHLIPGVSGPVLVLAGVLPLLPGLTLTTAMTELSTRHLLAGTARLTGAGVTFVQLAFGVAIGASLGQRWPATVGPVSAELPAWLDVVILGVSSMSYALLLGALRRDTWLVVVMGYLAFYTAGAASRAFGPELGAFVGAFTVGAVANGVSAVLGRPATVLVVPGILLLVPGSVGFRGVFSLLQHDADAGVNMAFRAALTAVALVAGLLFAHTIVRPRKVL